MFDNYTFEEVQGENGDKDLILFSLSTCGFCRRAKAFLDSKGLKYRYIQADELALDDKTTLKSEFKENFNDTLHFPTLLIDSKEFLVGFVKPHWEMSLLENSNE